MHTTHIVLGDHSGYTFILGAEGTTANSTNEGQPIMAKYSWKSKQGPLGYELDVKQGEKLTKLGVHAENEHWWHARNVSGDEGLVPASYMLVGENL